MVEGFCSSDNGEIGMKLMGAVDDARRTLRISVVDEGDGDKCVRCF